MMLRESFPSFIKKYIFDSLDNEKSKEWKEEYIRLGKIYAKWASIFVVFGAPLIMFSEIEFLTNSYRLWFWFRLGPSILTAVALIFFFIFKNKVTFIHEYLFCFVAYLLYINSGFWADCQEGYNTFLFGQLCVLVPTALITLLRPFLYFINFVLHSVIILLVFQFTCHQDFTVLLTSFQYFIFLILAFSSYLFAIYRYYLIRKNLIFHLILKEALDDVEEKRMKSDELLLNILPAEIAQELKAKGSSMARQYDEVTIMFIDFVNFTGISEKLSPKELVRNIHESFTAFDKIIEKYDIEKIKTIGDAYLAVSGLPRENKRHAYNITLAALEIRDYMANSKNEFQIRIGINSGTVVAGIVGVKKFAYDIWGDAVNIAARMEQNSEVGKINVSKKTYLLIKEDFNFEHRGEIAAKNKGNIDMYYVDYK
ncbi:adenylate/guanylate cyclase domain-containing protein [Aquiflexum sp.]|uniref:adenylate/guanylate cyclase domain-containing protein n=1 Tax=Aquiflexum sp. TaxID=1872584 RepID=UPI0035941264